MEFFSDHRIEFYYLVLAALPSRILSKFFKNRTLSALNRSYRWVRMFVRSSNFFNSRLSSWLSSFCNFIYSYNCFFKIPICYKLLESILLPEREFNCNKAYKLFDFNIGATVLFVEEYTAAVSSYIIYSLIFNLFFYSSRIRFYSSRNDASRASNFLIYLSFYKLPLLSNVR